MADHRDRDEGAPEAGNGQGAPEPEFGSSEWLLQQLSGGRLTGDSTRDENAEADAEADAEPPTGPRRSNWVEPPASTTPLVVPSLQEPEPRMPEVRQPEAPEPEVSEPEVEPIPTFDPQFANPEDTRELFLRPSAEPEPPVPFAAEAGDAPTSVDRTGTDDSSTSTGAVPVFEPGAPFSWHLTPGVGADPLVEPDARPDERPDELAPFEAPSSTESLPIPEPPSWDVLLTGAATEEFREASNTPTPSEEPEEAPSAWDPFAAEPPAVEPRHESRADRVESEPPIVLVPPVFPPAMDVPPPVAAEPAELPEQPEQPAQPEQPQTEPVAGDADAGDGHGLASLLGFFDGAPEDEQPSSHSVIGDTTGIVIVPDASLAPPSNEPTPVEPTPVEPTSTAPVPPVIPIPAGSFFEPSSPLPEPPSPPPAEPSDAAPASAADTPTTKLDRAEIAALLNARTGDPQPDEFSPSAPGATGGVPPLEEATLLMGALPSPATQPLDAASLAEASEAGAEAGADAADDGLASLLGEETTPRSAPSAADAILFPEFAASPTEVLPSTVGTSAPAAPAASGAALPPTSAFPVPAPAGPGTSGGSGGLGGSPNANRLLFWVAGGLAVVLVLIGLFALGTRLPSLFGGAIPVSAPTASTQASATPTPTPTPTVQAKPAGPQSAGTHPWNTLGGGECIDPYTTPWAETFTVVDCAAPHAAQMVYTNLFSADPAAPYPGADALAQQINLLCTKPGIIDLAAAGAYPDLQLQGTYPATEKQWKDGQRSYYCFANRSSAQPLTSSVAGPGPAA